MNTISTIKIRAEEEEAEEGGAAEEENDDDVTEVNKSMSNRQTQSREMNGQADVEVDYKRKYKNLKRKLKFLVYEQECFQEELRRSQRKLLKVSRDKRRRNIPGSCLPSSSSPHLSLLSRPGINPLQSSGSGPYLNTVAMAANYPSAPAVPPAASGPFSWVPRQMLSGDAAEEEGESDGDSDRGDEDRGEGDEAELVIDIPNE
ncbi:INO80 complex subunit E [Liparis tanakae]|uniref:INO80 complex subunit E n=1 Tax=Liparis tanakae TaxID=230148 RepID=A0A4Z2IUI1_9TELE|nr:INO80 complex subunit E [Liparis tanakae]